VFKQISSVDPKYLAATDILIGDMSDINNEFLLFNRPIILLANQWLRENFPDIGIKTGLKGIEGAIKRSIENPDEFKEQRKYWLKRTIYEPDGKSSKRVIDTTIKHSGIENPRITIIHGDNAVLKSNLEPLMSEARRRNFKVSYIKSIEGNSIGGKNNVFISAHLRYLKDPAGYNVHLDHGLKGRGADNFEYSIGVYKEYDYFPLINLHIVAGEIGLERTRILLGPLRDRAVIAGYPKADDLIRLNSKENTREVFDELEFNKDRLLITYAPAGKKSFMKPGGSFSKEVVDELKRISSIYNYNILVKIKYPKEPFVLRILSKLRRTLFTKPAYLV